MIELSTDKDLIGPWVFDRLRSCPWAPAGRETIGLVRGTEVLAGVVFENATGVSIEAHVALAHKNVPLRRLIPAVFHYTFIDLDCTKLVGRVNSANRAALTFNLKLGLRPEAVVAGLFPDGDLVIMVLNRSECRWIPTAYRTAA